MLKSLLARFTIFSTKATEHWGANDLHAAGMWWILRYRPKTEVRTGNGLKYVICSDYCWLRWNPYKQTSYKSILLLPGPFPPFHVTKRHIIRNESFRRALCFWQTGDDDWSESSAHPPQLESTPSSSHPIEADGESAFRGRGNWSQRKNTNCKRIPVNDCRVCCAVVQLTVSRVQQAAQYLVFSPSRQDSRLMEGRINKERKEFQTFLQGCYSQFRHMTLSHLLYILVSEKRVFNSWSEYKSMDRYENLFNLKDLNVYFGSVTVNQCFLWSSPNYDDLQQLKMNLMRNGWFRVKLKGSNGAEVH